MRQIAFLLAYDGTDFHGWQKQAGLRTVQGELEEVLSRVVGHQVSIKAASRTDAGTHAEGQVVTFVTEAVLSAEALVLSLNRRLSPQIVVKRSWEVPLSFDPRRDAKSRVYAYLLDTAPQPAMATARFCLHYTALLDEGKMADQSRALIGWHDFRCFQGLNSRHRSSVRRMYQIAFCRKGPYFAIVLEANSFLYQMARRIVTALLRIGTGAACGHDLEEAMKKRLKRIGEPPAPSRGLWLQEVRFSGEGSPLAPPAFLTDSCRCIDRMIVVS